MKLMTAEQLNSLCEEIKTKIGCESIQWTQVQKPLTKPRFDAWIDQSMHGDMAYLKKSQSQRASLTSVLPNYKTGFFLTFSYKPHPAPFSASEVSAYSQLKIASYAGGYDYHDWLPQRLSEAVQILRASAPEMTFVFGTDILPILERDLASQAGLGWIGKNTCLIHPKRGSFFFIAEILTDLEVVGTAPSFDKIKSIPDFCGKCTRCIDACPTQAIEAPRVLNATKCISFWTIEARSVPPLELRKGIGSHFFGCDICQSVCPWNEKIFGKTPASAQPQNQELEDSLRLILTSSNRQLEKIFKSSPLLRSRPFGLRRNALVVIGNLKISSLKAAVDAQKKYPDLIELADWCLLELNR